MRPLKFRAWDTVQKKMIRWTDLLKHKGLLWSVLGVTTIERYDHQHGRYGVPTPVYIPMQYTGLLDRNGKDVWEGDIIKYTNNDGIKRVGFVEWFEEEACFYLNSLPLWEQTEKEVIGNIYQNPELLEEK